MKNRQSDHSAAILSIFATLSFLMLAILTFPGEHIRLAMADPSYGVSYRR